MSIKFECPQCQKKLNVPDVMAGKKGRCTNCKAPLVVPGTPAAPLDTVPASTEPVPNSAAQPATGGNGPRSRFEPRPGPPPRVVPGKTAPAASGRSPEDIEALAAAAFTDKSAEPEQIAEETIKFECDYCGFALEVSADLGGKRTQCPDCRRITKVPEAVKRAAKVWHRAAQTQAEAQAAEAAKEGAWGTANITAVDQKALVEEGILPDDTPPLTRAQTIVRWSLRGAVAAAVVGLLVFSVYQIASWWGGRKKEKLYAEAALAAKQDNVSSEGRAVLFTAAGDYRRRQARPRSDSMHGSASEAHAQFQEAFQHVAQGTGHDRDLALTRLALAEVELGGEGDDVVNEVCEKWDEVQRSLRTTLTAIHEPEARALALRAVCRRLLARKQAERARSLALQVTEPAGSDGDDRAASAEILAQAGLELLTSQRPLAEQIAANLARFGSKAGDPPPLRPAVVALLTTLGNKNQVLPVAFIPPAHKQEMTREERIQAMAEDSRGAAEKAEVDIGQVEALARQGRLDEARRRADGLGGEVQLQALIVLAEAAHDANPADRADVQAACKFAASIQGEPNQDWARVRLVELGRRAGLEEDSLTPVAAAIVNRELRGRAQLAIFRGKLARARGVLEESVVDAVEAKTLARALARLELARTNTRQSSDYVDQATAWGDGMRAFGIIGALLGLQGGADEDEP
jgi:hypothetical protein